VKNLLIAAMALAPLLFSCFPKQPEIPMLTMPPEPLLQGLERHRREFVSLKAVANVEIDKRGRKRAFDTVGIVIDGRDRIRIEAYGPLGQSLAAIVWNSRELLLRMPEDNAVTRTGPERLERLLSRGLTPRELCIVLSGNVPSPGDGDAVNLLCSERNDCILEVRSGELLRRVQTSLVSGGLEPRIRSYAVYRSGDKLFSALFDQFTEISGYLLPMHIIIESPGDSLRMAVAYSDVDVNGPLENEAFRFDDNANGPSE